MFMGPYDLGGDWSDKGIVGVDRFVQRTYSLFKDYNNYLTEYPSAVEYEIDKLNPSEKDVYRKVNITLDKYEQELENLRFNTAVAALMELLNELTKSLSNSTKGLITFSLERFAYMLAPLAPHLGEECWQILGGEKSLFQNPLNYSVDEKALIVDSVTVVVQVNGKIRAKLELPADSEESVVKEKAWSDENVKSHTNGKTAVKEIYVKNKIYNIVVK
jgi:leucyl-tRNA synthetase